MDISTASLMTIYKRARALDEELMRRKPDGMNPLQWRVENHPRGLENTAIPVVDRGGVEMILMINYQMDRPLVAVMADGGRTGPVSFIDLEKPDAEEILACFSYDDRDVWAPMKALVRALNEPPRLQ